MDGGLCPPEELVHLYFVEVINALHERDVFKKWLAVFDEFNVLWRVDAAERRQLMPWLYGNWNDGNWLSEMEDLAKNDLE